MLRGGTGAVMNDTDKPEAESVRAEAKRVDEILAGDPPADARPPMYDLIMWLKGFTAALAVVLAEVKRLEGGNK